MANGVRFRPAAIAGFVLITGLLLLGQTKRSARSPVQKQFAVAVDHAFQKGVQAKLPPHISTLLGIAQEQECPVKQGIQRTGTMVEGIDVSIANKNNVVLFVVDETANDQTLYLTSPAGRLRKVVMVKAGVGRVSRITDKDRKAFEVEKQFWADRLAASPAPK